MARSPKEPGDEGSGTMVDIPGAAARGYLCMPRSKPKAGTIVIHEWWGLNHNVKSMAEKLSVEGYAALAVDLYGGQVAQDADTAGAMMKALTPAKALPILKGAVKQLKSDPIGVAKVGTVGWCMGGGWSLRTAVACGKDVSACVVYYGDVPSDPAKLEGLAAPVLGIFATRDQWITPKAAADFAAAMRQAGKPLDKVDYPNDHAFANPSNPHHDQAAARSAWDRTLAFFAQHLK